MRSRCDNGLDEFGWPTWPLHPEPPHEPESLLVPALLMGGLILLFALVPEAKGWVSAVLTAPWVLSIASAAQWVAWAALTAVVICPVRRAGSPHRVAWPNLLIPGGVLLLILPWPARFAASKPMVVWLAATIVFGGSAWLYWNRWPVRPVRRVGAWVAVFLCGLLSGVPMSQGHTLIVRIAYFLLAIAAALAAWLLIRRDPPLDDASDTCLLTFGSGLWLSALVLSPLGAALFRRPPWM